MVTIGAIAAFIGASGAILSDTEKDIKWFGKILAVGVVLIFISAAIN